MLLHLHLLLGLILVPNGEKMGYAMGDTKAQNVTEYSMVSAHRITAGQASPIADIENKSNIIPDMLNQNFTGTGHKEYHPWGIFFTVLGTVLLDFDADACQSPARAYLLDVTIEGNHQESLLFKNYSLLFKNAS